MSYPAIEPHEHGMLDVGDGNLVSWETCGNPDGKPALVVHGGPGSGCTPWHRRLFDPAAYRAVLFDQRGCGRSTPHASERQIDLSTNTTQHLVTDMELLRRDLNVDRWLLLGGSWGSTLSLAYAEAYPDRVSEIVLWGVTTGRRAEADWWFRGGVATLFPAQWAALREGVPDDQRDRDIVEAYSRMLHDPDPEVRRRAALAWCTWESATPEWPPTGPLDERYTDPEFALAFARLVTHYIRHDVFLEDGILLRNASLLADIPGVLVHGRQDLMAPIANAWELKQAWPDAELVVVDDEGHASSQPGIQGELIRATDRFASSR
ncbi:MAG: prolyl aminopeptidase [Actinomycetota bacterium]|nr:prolyl aminopeptidase [Actinomycetota bacterium]